MNALLSPFMRFSRKYFGILFLFVFSVIPYANTLTNSFVWDDHDFIVDRHEIRDIGNVAKYFTQDVYGIYRPLREILYHYAYSSSGNSPLYYHLMAILFHASVVILAFLVIRKLFGYDIAFFASLIFAVHPLHIERVTNMTASFDILGIILFLLSFFFYISYREKADKKMLVFSIVTFALILLASEEALTLPFLVILYEFVFGRDGHAGYYKAIPHFALFAGFVIFRTFVLGIGARTQEYPGGSFFVTFLTMPKIIIEYLLLVFFPFGLTPFRKVEYVNSFGIWFVLPVIAILLCFYLVYKYRKNNALVFFSGWFVIALLPFLNILPLQKIIAERYMYVASLALIALISCLILKFKKYSYQILGIVVTFFIILTLHNNSFWKDDFTLYSRGLSLNPEDVQANNNMGKFFFDMGDYETAFYYYNASIKTNPRYHKALVNMGVLQSKIGNYRESVNYFITAINVTPGSWLAYEKLGITYMRAGDNESARQMFLTAIKLNENYYSAYSKLAALYGNMGNYSLALAYIEKALEINPYYAEAHFNLGVLYELNGRMEEAKQFYINAAVLDPGNKAYQEKAR